MNKVEESILLLKLLGLPKQQQNERSALTLLALANIKETDDWDEAEQVSMSVVGSKNAIVKYPGIMHFIDLHYSHVRTYKENSRESFRRQTLHQFVQAGVCAHNPEEPDLPINSSKNHYRLTNEVLFVLHCYGSPNFDDAIKHFAAIHGGLAAKYAGSRELHKIPLTLPDGTELSFSPGKHNQVQVAVIKEFASRFAQDSKVVYVGDTANKGLYLNKKLLEILGIPIDQHTKLPDLVLYEEKKDWLFLIEAVTSHGPISPKRYIELEQLLENCKSGKVYVTAFPDRTEFRKHVADIAWETEVWIVSDPEHMIHFNGDRFMGPR